jgi:hypothetical protein
VTFALLLPALLSLLVLAAHFLRSGQLLFVAAALAAAALAAVPRRWAARAMQLVLALGAVEWIRTLVVLVDARRAEGRPWTRLAVILACVALVCALSVLAFATRRLRVRYARA